MDASTSSKSLLENHEQQYAVVSAEITSKINKLSSGSGNSSNQTNIQLNYYVSYV